MIKTAIKLEQKAIIPIVSKLKNIDDKRENLFTEPVYGFDKAVVCNSVGYVIRASL